MIIQLGQNDECHAKLETFHFRVSGVPGEQCCTGSAATSVTGDLEVAECCDFVPRLSYGKERRIQMAWCVFRAQQLTLKITQVEQGSKKCIKS